MSGEGVGGVCELASQRAGGISERSGEIPEARRLVNFSRNESFPVPGGEALQSRRHRQLAERPGQLAGGLDGVRTTR